MKLLVMILNKVELMNDLLSVIVEAGITKATILDSEGLGQHLAYEVPIFAGLRKLVGESKSYNKTILALVDDDTVLMDLKKLLKQTDMDFSKDGMGIIFSVSVDSAIDLDK
ncbi:MAG: hypothetical protein ABIH89_08570 [Elusimicrobiota bacterium]